MTPTDLKVTVGTLEPGASAEFEYAIGLAEGTSPGTRRLPFVVEYRPPGDEAVPKTQAAAVNVSYQDDAGRQLTTGTQQVAIDVVEPATTFPIVPAVVAVLALTGVGYWWYRRR